MAIFDPKQAIVLRVSSRDSPFSMLDVSGIIFNTFAPKFLAATSNEILVLVSKENQF